MGDGVIAALITGGITLVGMIASSVMTHSKFKAISEYQIRELKEDIGKLSDRVDKHNNLVERMALVEASVKSAHRRIDELKGDMKD